VTRIAVDPGRALGPVDRNVFGGFIEHLGRCIYGGIYDEGSALADERGFRKDVLALVRDLRVGVLRWPGGNFVSNCRRKWRQPRARSASPGQSSSFRPSKIPSSSR
jgi:alpha-N-arabinofuranosidase